MEGIGTILGVVALFVSLAALWFVNDMAKRVERQGQQLVEAHLKALKEGLAACESEVKSLEKRIAESARQVTDLMKKGAEGEQTSTELRASIETVRADLDALDKSIPASYRNQRSGRRGD